MSEAALGTTALRLRAELGRKTLHISMGGFAFLLRYLTWWQAALCALVALTSNLLLLPRIGGRHLFRGEAAERGHDVGIVLYPASVLVLILALPHNMEIVAASWAMLAFGDGLATVFGVTFGRLTGALPWNGHKSWAGLLGFLVGGIPMALALIGWTTQQPLSTWVVAIVVAVGLLTAIIETLEVGVNDNLVVPFAAAALFVAAAMIDPQRAAADAPLFLSRLPFALAANLAAAGIAYALRSVDVSGFVHGVFLGTALWVFGGWPAWTLLLAFFVIGTAATKIGYRTKLREGTAQEKGGRRGAKHAWANTGGPFVFALLAGLTVAESGYSALFMIAVAGAFATATSDTLGSEIGQAFGRRTFLITTFRPVPRGTDGAVSLEGTLAGIAGSAVIGALAWATGAVPGSALGWIVIGAFVGTTLESYLGALLERRHLIDNEAQNFLNTVAGGLIAFWLAIHFS